MSNLAYQSRIFAAVEATWPPAARLLLGPWILREGQGGGKRVSAASLTNDGFTQDDIDTAEAAMIGLGQSPLFVIHARDVGLDASLAQRGYRVIDPVIAYAAPCKALIAPPTDGSAAYPNWPPLALVQDIWRGEGIGPARVAVMSRAKGPKTALLLRHGDHPAGVCFVSLAGDIGMVHALEVVKAHRRHGHGRALIHAAALWAQGQGARDFALVVTADNAPARALYQSLGMCEQGRYHYRNRP